MLGSGFAAITSYLSPIPRTKGRFIDPFQLADVDLVFNGPRIQYRVEESEQRNKDGTIDFVLVSGAKFPDKGFEFSVRDEQMSFDEDRFHEFKFKVSYADSSRIER